MKKIILTIIFLLCSSYVYPASLTLTWNAPPELWGTYIYIRAEPNTYDFEKPVGIVPSGIHTYTINNLKLGTTYYAVATHFDTTTNEESNLSNEVMVNFPVLPIKLASPLPEPILDNYTITITISPGG